MAIKMLKINGKLFPFTDALASRSDAIVVEVEPSSIRSNVGPSEPLKLLTKKTDKPGPGWVKKNGRWVKGVYKGHKNRHLAKDALQVQGGLQ
jgi:hypothetical protein